MSHRAIRSDAEKKEEEEGFRARLDSQVIGNAKKTTAFVGESLGLVFRAADVE